ncbi:AfsR/SARP family transcriptional regulator [Streptomyces sp. SID7909]|uniref:AfsR/SARP family transcriptional regulator n=1 Tax=Streptomyces sp. SID7909 TaxID=2706092 RepID=UPI0013BBD87A|nr:AfsR/SARP family transcriptional regulator [Streptomyces sp. SID7909]NEC09497.1 AfsR/SARP family transcriptional regulator [Streptomyces sp. SID7909]
MKFGVLGPLFMRDGSASRLPSAPKTRQLLSLLLFHANSQVSLDACVHELWDEAIPRSAVQSIHTRVFQLRQALAASPSVGSMEEAKSILETHHNGYSLRVAPGEIDLHLLDDHLQDIRGAQAAEEDLLLSSKLRSALGLWRGPTLVDVEHGPQLQAYVTGMEGRRLMLLEQCIDAQLRLGQHHELLAELSRLVFQYPSHENLHAQYMIALYRSGRAAQALAEYQRLRVRLTGELGMEPSSKLRRLQTAILAESSELVVRPTSNTKLSLDLIGTR